MLVLRCQLLLRSVQWFRGGLVFKTHRLCVSLNSRLESNQEEEEEKLTMLVLWCQLSVLRCQLSDNFTKLSTFGWQEGAEDAEGGLAKARPARAGRHPRVQHPGPCLT